LPANKSQAVTVALVASLLAFRTTASAAGVQPTASALKIAETFHARSMGVDRAGNLWAWEPRLETVTFVTPSGSRLSSFRVPGAGAVDADSEWGVLALLGEGRELRWFRGRRAEDDVALRLDTVASEICWAGDATAAVAPQAAAYRVGIWNLKDKVLVATFGQETPLHPVFGATRMRAVVMRYDFRRDLLYALESFLGDLQVFAMDGKPAWHAAIEHPLRGEHEKWLLDVDRRAKQRRDVQTPVIHWFYLALDDRGDAWVVRNVDAPAQSVSLFKLSPGGNTAKPLAGVACASRTFTIWGDWIISFTDPASPRVCCQARRLS
jgi:hypothetical protein